LLVDVSACPDVLLMICAVEDEIFLARAGAADSPAADIPKTAF